MKHLYILFLLLAQTAFSQIPMPDFPCYKQTYKSTNEYGIDFYQENWQEKVSDTMDLYAMKKGISTVEGTSVLLPIYDEIFVPNDLRDSCLIEIPYAIVTLNDKQFVINLETGARTKMHASILYDDHMFFYRDLKVWGVYDLEFHFLIKDLQGIPGTNGDPSDLEICESCTTTQFGYTNGFTLEMKNNLKAKGIEIEFPKVVLYRIRNEPATEKELLKMEQWQKKHPTEPWDKDKLGLVDLTSGKKISPCFDKIEAKLLNDQIYYWCYNYSWKYPVAKTNTLTIYNKHLKEVFHYESDYLPRGNLETEIPNPSENMELYGQLHYFQPRENVYFIKDKHNHLGAINASGKLVVPFIYDSISYQRDEKFLYKIWTNGLFHWLTNDGTKLLDAIEAQTMRDVSDELQYYVRTDTSANSWYLVDPVTNQKIGPFDEFYSIWTNNTNQFLRFNSWMLNQSVYLVRQGNELYYSMNHQFHRIDSTTYSFINKAVLIHNMIIDRKGKILYTGNSFYELNHSSYIEFSKDKVPLRIFHVDGVKILELEEAMALKPSQFKKDEVWFVLKNHKSRCFNLETWKWNDE